MPLGLEVTSHIVPYEEVRRQGLSSLRNLTRILLQRTFYQDHTLAAYMTQNVA